MVTLKLFLNTGLTVFNSINSAAFTLQAYTEELVELHRRLMALRERNVLQQVCTHILIFQVTEFGLALFSCHFGHAINFLELTSMQLSY